MKEVLTRRFQHGMEETKELEEKQMEKEFGSFTRFPDLLLMDGGKGQVNVALQVLSELGLSIPVCGMVKDDNHRTRGLYYQNREIAIDTRSEASNSSPESRMRRTVSPLNITVPCGARSRYVPCWTAFPAWVLPGGRR